MITARNEGYPSASAALQQELVRETQVFVGGMALVLHQDTLFRHALLQQIGAHRRRLRDGFVMSAAAADDQKRFFSAFMIQLQRKIETIRQDTRYHVTADQRAAVDDHGIEGPFP